MKVYDILYPNQQLDEAGLKSKLAAGALAAGLAMGASGTRAEFNWILTGPAKDAFTSGEYVKAAKLYAHVPGTDINTLSAQEIQLDAGILAGEAQDYSEELRLLSPLANKGDPSAQYHIGLMYLNGDGVPQNFKTAFRWINKAATIKQYSKAQFLLATLYYNGQGVSKDNILAYAWTDLAVSNATNRFSADSFSRPIYIDQRNIIAKQLTPQQLDKAQDIAEELEKQLRSY